jgi:hypothetical protein
LKDLAQACVWSAYNKTIFAIAEATDGYVVEWVTAGDAHVCGDCEEHEGKRYYRGWLAPQIPLHPNCRCELWIVEEEE